MTRTQKPLLRLDDHEDIGGAWEHLKGRGSLAFDIGANIGQASRVLCQGYRHVIAFEPCQESFEILQAECANNVTPFPLAVSDHTGTIRLAEMSYSISTGQLTSGAGLSWGELVGSREVSCITLHDLVNDYGLPDFIKIDTEGHEVKIVEGGIEELMRVPKIIIEVHSSEYELPIRTMLSEREFFKLSEPFYVDPGTRANHFWLQSSLRGL